MSTKLNFKNKIIVAFMAYLLVSCSSSQVKSEPDSVKESYKIEKIENRENSEIPEELAILYGEDDPLGAINRRIYYFNGMADRYVLKPTVSTYKYYTPNFFQKRVSNFFTNFENVGYALNSFLQLKFTEGMETTFRFAINSTVGILGLFDPATSLGIPKHKQSMGLTLAYYGVGRGAYLVLPFMGPSNIRDSVALTANGFAVDAIDPYHPVNIDFGELYMLALYGFSVKADTNIYFMESDYVFEYEYARLLGKKYVDLLEKRNKLKK